MMEKLTPQDAAEAVRALPDWTLDSEARALSREFVFADFSQAFAFMTQVAIAAEKHNHHPEWSNVYNRVRVTWTTHDAAGLTHKDRSMAALCDRIGAGYTR